MIPEDIKGTQIAFCDIGTPKGEGIFDVYHALKDELIKKGIPEDEISFIHEAKTDAQKEALFEKMRSGEKRIIIGSTNKLGVGTNIQDRVVAMHHIDCPWRPSDIEQRDGRGVKTRQYKCRSRCVPICNAKIPLTAIYGSLLRISRDLFRR